MVRKLFTRAWPLLVLATIAGSSCGQQAGTYVLVQLDGTVDTGRPIAKIQLGLGLGLRSDTTSFQAPGGGAITLPTSATLEIRSGQGEITISAQALDGDGGVLGIGTGTGHISAGQTITVPVHFSPYSLAIADAGVDGARAGDAARKDTGSIGTPDLPDERLGVGGSTGNSDLGAAGTGGVHASGGSTGTGGIVGAGGTGGTLGKDAGPDAPAIADGPITSDVPSTYQLTINVAKADFGVWPVGSVASAQSLTITNTGGSTATNLTIFVGDGTHFPVYQDRCSGAVLAPGNACTVAFTFVPDVTGALSTNGSVGVPGGSSVGFMLSGTGAGKGAPTLTLSPQSVDFTQVDVGVGAGVPFTITNNGAANSGPIQIQITGSAEFQTTNNNCSAITLGNLGQCTFTLLFQPTTIGSAQATITALSSSGMSGSSTASGTGRDKVQLSIQFAGNGAGTVIASGTTCTSGSPCNVGVVRTDPNALPKIDLSAKPNASSQFSGWSGDCSGSTCTVVMDANHSVTATFNAAAAPQVTLNVLGLAGQQGTVASSDGLLSCSSNCANMPYTASGNLTLVAKPTSSATFVGWTDGPCHGTNPKCVFTPVGNVSVTATFGPQSYMFVSSSVVVPGNLGGVAGADSECQRLAGNASLPGTYQAWLTVTGKDARGRVGSGGWVRTDGRPFAHNLATLGTNSKQIVYYPPRLDENGNDLGNTTIYVATGSNQDGSYLGAQCADYTSPTGSIYVGNAAAGSLEWSMTELHSDGCSRSYHLYCFRTDDQSADLTPPPQPGRRVFISQKAFTPSTATSPDQACQTEAASANLTNPAGFIAFVATTTAAALQRLSATGSPWKRTDDVMVVRQLSDFGAGKLLAPLDLGPDGVSYTTSQVWTGASNPTVQAGANCGDWTSNAASTQGMIGAPSSSAAPDWFSFGGLATPCNDTNTHLICIEP
jgi:Divergent InlB B-repeat domain